MKGDFSKAARITAANDLGVLYQQGRVIADRDLTEAELIAQSWRETAARDVIGAGAAAVPAHEPDGFRVEAAALHDGHVDIRLTPGRIWADGIHLTLPPAEDGSSPHFGATYLDPPANPAGADVDDIGDGIRDAVILEVSLGALSGFQDPARLIEAALGGPDTAMRIHPRQALRLLRLAEGEDCTTITPRLRDDLSNHGRLSVTLEPATVVAGDCPVVEGGGYSGFEHNLYRIEIAETDSAAVMFKWSSTNGGLVGRGRFIGGADPRVEITANRAAILNSGIAEYYLEALEFDSHLGHWRLVYATPATLNADGDIDLAAPSSFGTMPGAGGTVFFRLWNGAQPIASYAAGPTPFRDGIELHFTSPAASYRAEDFWTFDLRAGEIENPETLHDDAPPEGPQLHRMALAEIAWTAQRDTDISGGVEDCRRRFRPLTNQKLCCTYLVGNGTTSFGDFNSLEEAVAHLPEAGGQVCLLPGIHLANLTLINRRNIKIHGCFERTMLLPRMSHSTDPVIRIEGGAQIEIADLDIFAPFGIAIDAAGAGRAPLRGLRIQRCRILSLTYGLRIESAQKATIAGNHVWLLDHEDARSAISIRASDSLIEKNMLGVWPHEFSPPIPEDDGTDQPSDQPPNPADPCIKPEQVYGNLTLVVGYVIGAWQTVITVAPQQPYRARGGLHLRGGCERIDIIGNRVDGGASHGIVLGGTYPDEATTPDQPDTAPVGPTLILREGTVPGNALDESGAPVLDVVLTLSDASGAEVQSQIAGPPDGRFVFSVPPGRYRLTASAGHQVVSATLSEKGVLEVVLRPVAVTAAPDAGFLYQIRIIDNRLERMGLSGIGFLQHSQAPPPPLVLDVTTPEAMMTFITQFIAPRALIGTTNLIRDIEIRSNRIQDNLRAVLTTPLADRATQIAQGGISLPLVEGARITDNYIARNGTSATMPCAGVFIAYGEEVILSGNHITGNGPLSDDYDRAGIAGLRGGVVIRMASAMVAGGATDAMERPALDIRNNHIDQPAGRAITAFAFGPVSCIGNHLNSEREGKGLVDRVVGAVLIANLGGLHRHFDTLGNADFAGDLPARRTHQMVGLAATNSVEALLPGGEIMFNANRVRMGGDHRAYGSMLLATFDDLGFDGNQSAIFQPDPVFANLIALGMSLRVSDSRFRERARQTAMSVLSWAFSFSGAGKPYALNATVYNQADHCIIAGSTARPELAEPNQIVFDQSCPVDPKSKQAYLKQAFLALMRIEAPAGIDPDKAAVGTPQAVTQLTVDFGRFQDQMLTAKAAEVQRVHQAQGAQDRRARSLRAEMYQRRQATAALVEQGKLAMVREVPAPAGDALVIDGRITDAMGSAVAGADVELVDARGRALGIGAKADAAGYYALSLTAEQKKQLAEIEGVTIRAELGDDKPAIIPATPILRGDPGKARADIATERLKDHHIAIRDVVVQPVRPVRPVDNPTDASVRPAGPTPSDEPNRPVTSPKPRDEPVRPGPVIELETLRGVGPAMALRLREAGIGDAEAILTTGPDKLREILGPRGDTIHSAAAEALRAARKRPDEG